jgi:hypothetical protein
MNQRASTFRVFLSLPLLFIVAALAWTGSACTGAAKWLYRSEEEEVKIP